MRFRVLWGVSFVLAYGDLLLDDHLDVQLFMAVCQYVLMGIAAFETRRAGRSVTRAIVVVLPFVAMAFSAALVRLSWMRVTAVNVHEGVDAGVGWQDIAFGSVVVLLSAVLAGVLGVAVASLYRRRHESPMATTGRPASGKVADRVIGVAGNLGGACLLLYVDVEVAQLFFEGVERLQLGAPGGVPEAMEAVVATGVLMLCVSTTVVLASVRAVFAAMGFVR